MKIAIGSDHAGFAYKEQIKTLLTSLGHEVRDFGTDSAAPVDYPAFIRPAAEAVARGECERGIVLGGSGNGEAIVANKVRDERERQALREFAQTHGIPVVAEIPFDERLPEAERVGAAPLDFAPDAGTVEVPDPYYGGPNGFEEVLDLVEAATHGLLQHLRARSRAA